MIKKITEKLSGISGAAKCSVILGCLSGTALLLCAFLISVSKNAPLSFSYLCENMLRTAVTLFAEGVFFGLLGDFLLTVVDRGRK